MRGLPDLAGPRVILSELRPEHVNAGYVAWLNDPETIRFTELRVGTTDEALVRRYVEEAVAADNTAMWRICLEGQHVGNIRLSGINRRHKRAEIAILIGTRDMRGKGIGSEAVELATAYALGELGLQKLSAGIYAGNVASSKAFEKAGYRCDAVLSRHAIFEGRRVDVMQWVYFASDVAAG